MKHTLRSAYFPHYPKNLKKLTRGRGMNPPSPIYFLTTLEACGGIAQNIELEPNGKVSQTMYEKVQQYLIALAP